MGYTTYFTGRFELDKPLSKKHLKYLLAFNGSRRMKRDSAKAEKMNDPVRKAVGLPIGVDGEFFVGTAAKNCGQEETPDILDFNCPPGGQPSLWCQWTPTKDGKYIEWDEGEKFHAYVEWLMYICKTFLKPWGYQLNGKVSWHGEDDDDRGLIVVNCNRVESARSEVIIRNPLA